MRPETRYAKSGSVNVAYQVVGEGPVDLVLVPGFVSHVDTATIAAAREAGIDQVLARGQFVQILPELLKAAR